MVLSANAASIGGAYNVDTVAAPALLAGTNQSKVAGLPWLPFAVPARPPATPPLSATAVPGTQIELSGLVHFSQFLGSRCAPEALPGKG
jgi:hypothetical protein